MRAVSLFAGIAGFDLGFERAGMKIVAHVEKDAQCRRLLAAKWPYAVALDDVRTAGKHNLPACDVVCGGFPCQDLSIAGKRAGLKNGTTRSGLFYQLTRITDELQPAFLVWENVPGLLSSDNGRDFARVLMELDRIGYHGAWRTLDAQYFGLAQRRRRVFGVFARADIGAARCAEILSLQEGLRGHPAPSRKAGQVSPAIPASGAGTSRTGNERTEAGFCVEVARPLLNGGNMRHREDQDTLILGVAPTLMRGSDNPSGHNARSGRSKDACLIPDICGSLKGGSGARGYPDPADAVDSMIPAVCGCLSSASGHAAGSATQQDAASGLLLPCGTLRTRGPCFGGQGTDWTQAVAVTVPAHPEICAPDYTNYIHGFLGVRRLTPTECERLQGFPDGWTAGFADGPRYRMLGNAVAVPCAEWIGKRIKEST